MPRYTGPPLTEHQPSSWVISNTGPEGRAVGSRGPRRSRRSPRSGSIPGWCRGIGVGGDPVDLLQVVLAHVGHPQVAGGLVEAEAPRVAHPGQGDLGPAAAGGEGVVVGDAVGPRRRAGRWGRCAGPCPGGRRGPGPGRRGRRRRRRRPGRSRAARRRRRGSRRRCGWGRAGRPRAGRCGCRGRRRRRPWRSDATRVSAVGCRCGGRRGCRRRGRRPARAGPARRPPVVWSLRSRASVGSVSGPAAGSISCTRPPCSAT